MSPQNSNTKSLLLKSLKKEFCLSLQNQQPAELLILQANILTWNEAEIHRLRRLDVRDENISFCEHPGRLVVVNG